MEYQKECVAFKPWGPKTSYIGVLKVCITARGFGFFVQLDNGYFFAKMQCLFGRPARQDL